MAETSIAATATGVIEETLSLGSTTFVSHSIFESCNESCGWIAAVTAVFTWGSFGVPLKLAPSHVEVNFFVMQTYKTVVCFITCWLVLLMGEPIVFTSWGILSGIFWVPGAACGIYGIRHAGLAIAVGTWSSIIVVTSFLFGIVVFQEQVKNIYETLMAFCILLLGLVGMSRYSDPSNDDTSHDYDLVSAAEVDDTEDRCRGNDGVVELSKVGVSDGRHESESSLIGTKPSTAKPTPSKRKHGSTSQNKEGSGAPVPPAPRSLNGPHIAMLPMQIEQPPSSTGLLHAVESSSTGMSLRTTAQPSLSSDRFENEFDDKDMDDDRRKKHSKGEQVALFGGKIIITKRQLGIVGSVINGAWGGMNLIPLHFAQRDLGISGATYLISYATGSMIVCIAIWILLILYNYYHALLLLPTRKAVNIDDSQAGVESSTSSAKSQISFYERHKIAFLDAIDALPKFHIYDLGIPGIASGTLYSIGNFCSILAVAYLGQGVGFSFCQGQLLVSGSWGVFYFGEIQGIVTRLKWFVSASLAITGIIWLSYEHQGSTGGGHR